MKFTAGILRALALGIAVAALAAVSAGPAAGAEGKPTNSAKLAKPLKEANDDIKAKKFADAIAKLKDAENIAGKTPFDQHLINDMLTFAYIKTQDFGDAAKVMEAEIDDGFTPRPTCRERSGGSQEINYQLKNYDKAIEFGTRAIKGGFGDDQIRTLVGQAYYLKGDWKGTLKFEEALADGQIKAGETPKNETLQLILSACVKLNDSGCETHALEMIVTYYPKPDYWYQLLYTLRQQTSGNDANTLQTYRLMSEVDVLKSADDYTEMAQLALEAGSRVKRSACSRRASPNVFTDQRVKERNQRLLENAKKAAASDQTSLAKQERDADAAPTGQKNVAVGLAYLGYGQYDKAVDELSKGLSKGGVKDMTQAQLLLGIAQLKAGHKEDAVKTFHAVKGDAGARASGEPLDSARQAGPGRRRRRQPGTAQMTIKAGERMPAGTFKRMTKEGPANITTDELFKGKLVVLFSVPGAFTPTCDAKHLPGFVQLADQIRAKGVDTIACMAVNDVFVMNAWGKASGVGDKVLMLADGNGEYAKALGLELDAKGYGMGTRGQRFAIIVRDGVATRVDVEAPGAFQGVRGRGGARAPLV